ncbi:hypothetical protein BD324DRAFT_608638 [Kockovaella imperatae]|uniref:SAM domain-containing protein n=1 Tax=Kockovaella imperatae TaxID=4999 RepID=A0A1Y1UJQ3_9TREE|nr:hypothetical protein BD324DRAFT_608638 [Kockovaella imperatae]ORX37355.1 hypothetical protein BD324DRAFT_608638 [Kockovaella imperatae]
MASQTLRPHRSPSPAPVPSMPSVNQSNPAKLTRQSLGPPSTSTGAAKGFTGLGITSPSFGAHPRHVSSSVAQGTLNSGTGRESLSPHPGMTAGRTVSGSATNLGGRPSSEYIPSGMGIRGEAKTPEAEQIDQWFKHLASWEQTLEEMAAASTDQNFTEELGAIEQWFRVLSEAERTAALYSLLQHSTPVQIRFFLSVLQHMAQSDPMTALLSPTPTNTATIQSRLDSLGLKSPSAGGGAGFPGSPTVGHFLAPESALDSTSGANKANMASSRSRQNRISAPGTLQPSDRWQSNLDLVTERGTSPGVDSNASTRSKSPDLRPKSTDFAGKDGRSPRLSGLAHPKPEAAAASPVLSPFLNNASWASMSNTPLVPMFTDPKIDQMASALNLANLSLNQSRVNFDDARKYRRGTTRNVSGQYNDDGDLVQPQGQQPGRATSPLVGQGGWASARSPVLDQFGLGSLGLGGDPSALSGLGVNLASLGINNANAAQMLALAQAQAQFSPIPGGNGFPAAYPGRGNVRGPPGRRSPLLAQRNSPNPDKSAGTGGGAGGGAGVAGPDDVDMKVLGDISGWLRILRLHKYTTNFEKSSWKDMVMMTDADLQSHGVSAQGARTKFLKVFYNVREKEGIPHPPGQEEFAPTAEKKDVKV